MYRFSLLRMINGLLPTLGLANILTFQCLGHPWLQPIHTIPKADPCFGPPFQQIAEACAVLESPLALLLGLLLWLVAARRKPSLWQRVTIILAAEMTALPFVLRWFYQN